MTHAVETTTPRIGEVGWLLSGGEPLGHLTLATDTRRRWLARCGIFLALLGQWLDDHQLPDGILTVIGAFARARARAQANAARNSLVLSHKVAKSEVTAASSFRRLAGVVQRGGRRRSGG